MNATAKSTYEHSKDLWSILELDSPKFKESSWDEYFDVGRYLNMNVL